MKTGAEIVLEWFRKYSEQNGTPTPFEIRCQLELAIEHDKTELKNLSKANVSSSVCDQCETMPIHSRNSYCGCCGDKIYT